MVKEYCLFIRMTLEKRIIRLYCGRRERGGSYTRSKFLKSRPRSLRRVGRVKH